MLARIHRTRQVFLACQHEEFSSSVVKYKPHFISKLADPRFSRAIALNAMAILKYYRGLDFAQLTDCRELVIVTAAWTGPFTPAIVPMARPPWENFRVPSCLQPRRQVRQCWLRLQVDRTTNLQRAHSTQRSKPYGSIALQTYLQVQGECNFAFTLHEGEDGRGLAFMLCSRPSAMRATQKGGATIQLRTSSGQALHATRAHVLHMTP